jgi:hypothetical protein
MADFFNLNLWMFFVIGIFGYLLCLFRYKFVRWVAPIVVLISITFVFTLRYYFYPVGEFGLLTWFRVGFSMFIALALPIAGALADYKDRYPTSNILP